MSSCKNFIHLFLIVLHALFKDLCVGRQAASEISVVSWTYNTQKWSKCLNSPTSKRERAITTKPFEATIYYCKISEAEDSKAHKNAMLVAPAEALDASAEAEPDVEDTWLVVGESGTVDELDDEELEPAAVSDLV